MILTMKRGHTPHRICVVCGKAAPKAELLRLVKQKGRKIKLDPVNKEPGRGIYMCLKKACLDKFLNGRAFKRRFHAGIREDVLYRLKEISEAISN